MRALRGFQSIRLSGGRLGLAAALKALRERCERIVAAPRDTALSWWAAIFGDGASRSWRRVRRAIAPLRMPSAAGRVEASTVAGVLLAVIVVAIALFLFGRGVLAHEGHDEAASGSSAPAAVTAAPAGSVDSGPHRLLDGSLFVPKDSQRLLNVRTVVSRVSEVGRTIRMVGQVSADPGTSGEVHASIRGRLEPYRGAWPKVGQKVEAGEVLAWVVPVVNPIDRGIILQQVAQIDHEIALIQDRLPGLGAADGAAASRELDDARADLANLVRRRDAIAAVIRDRDTLRAPLLAPSTGIVAASFAASGQVVDEQQKLFTVVDLKRLWVEAYAYDIAAVSKVLDANAQGAAGGNYHLKFISRGPQLQRQTIPLYFQIDNPDETVSVGSLVSVLVQTSGERSGVILPRTAVTRNASGQDIVWQHAYPESFVPIPVRTESIDGNNVLIAAGLAPDTRIVVEAAELLNEVR
jgi:biotin carboxyl carrier protein